MIQPEQVKAQVLDHLGIVAAIVDDLRIDKIIDSLIPKKSSNEKISHGDVVKAMIINGMGFQERRLYLMSDFFRHRPIEALFREGIVPEHFNESVCGRTLDKIHSYGVENFFFNIVAAINNRTNFFDGLVNNDTTSLSFKGKYRKAKRGDGRLAHGHSKDGRPDLLQLIISMSMSGAANLPTAMNVYSGNASDRSILPAMVSRAAEMKSYMGWSKEIMAVADSCLYSEQFVRQSPLECKWVTRIPETIRKACHLLELDHNEYDWEKCGKGGKLICHEEEVVQFGIPQMWIVYFSERAHHKEVGTLINKVYKEGEHIHKKLNKIRKTVYALKNDARSAVRRMKEQHPLFKFSFRIFYKTKTIKRGKKKIRKHLGFDVMIEHRLNEEKFQKLKNRKGKFILGTYEVTDFNLTPELLLKRCKRQDGLEKGFQFIKDSTFKINEVFLKKKERIHALLCVMVLTLFVYNYGQWKLRRGLRKNKEYYREQRGQMTKNPSLKWVFQHMRHIVLVTITTKNKVQKFFCNMNYFHKTVIDIFSGKAHEVYGFL